MSLFASRLAQAVCWSLLVALAACGCATQRTCQWAYNNPKLPDRPSAYLESTNDGGHTLLVRLTIVPDGKGPATTGERWLEIPLDRAFRPLVATRVQAFEGIGPVEANDWLDALSAEEASGLRQSAAQLAGEMRPRRENARQDARYVELRAFPLRSSHGEESGETTVIVAYHLAGEDGSQHVRSDAPYTGAIALPERFESRFIDGTARLLIGTVGLPIAVVSDVVAPVVFVTIVVPGVLLYQLIAGS